MTQDEVRRLFDYDAATGALIWKPQPQWRPNMRSRLEGKRAGSSRKDGYLTVGVRGREYLAHRLVWLLVNGEIPEGLEIDHIDRNPANNKLDNLRLVNRAGNNRNRAPYSKHGTPKGVHKHGAKYRARIRYRGATHMLGSFNSAAEAHEIYALAADLCYGELACSA